MSDGLHAPVRRLPRAEDALVDLAPRPREGHGNVNRSQLEHVIRAAATIAADTEIVVIGSQAILGRFPEAPAELLASADVDVYPKNHPERADLIEGSIGEARDYVRAAIRHRLVTPATLHERLGWIPLDPASRERIARQIDADSAT